MPLESAATDMWSAPTAERLQAPYIWSRATGLVTLPGGFFTLYPLAVNSSGSSSDSKIAPRRAVLWNQQHQRIYLDQLDIADRGGWVGFEYGRTISDDGVITGVGRFTTTSGASNRTTSH